MLRGSEKKIYPRFLNINNVNVIIIVCTHYIYNFSWIASTDFKILSLEIWSKFQQFCFDLYMVLVLRLPLQFYH